MKSVDLYCANIKDWNIDLLLAHFSNEELSSLRTIKHNQTFNQKIVGRFLLKFLLIHRYRIKPEQIIFEYSENGKPSLANQPFLHFNSSHSNELVLIGISQNCIIGIDIEWIQKLSDEDKIAKSFFSSSEYSTYKSLRPYCPYIFYHFWTAKESFIKALGRGLWEEKLIPEIIINDNQFSFQSKPEILNDWYLRFLDVHQEYIACLVANQPDIEIVIEYIKHDYVLDLKNNYYQ